MVMYITTDGFKALKEEFEYLKSIERPKVVNEVAEAAAQGLGTCILGWFDDDKIRALCDIKNPVRLVITVGYPKDETIRPKKRKEIAELVTEI